MNSSPKKRVFFNIVATYSRSIFDIICALVTGGWTYIILGQVDYGLLNVVGGLTAFVSIFNNVLASSVGRFYAYSVGEARTNQADGIKNCQIWFNTAITIHSIVPLILLIIGYPIGVYAVKHWLTIPIDRIGECVWIWRFSCISCFASMVSVPFYAMYTAKQYIAELTVYTFTASVFHLLFVGYMYYHPRDWFTTLAFFQCLLVVLPQVVISLRAYMIFEECRLMREYLFHREYLKQILNFSAFQGLGIFSNLLRTQGIVVLTNVYFGPSMNAAMSISTKIINQTQSLTQSISGAFSPAITNACGANDYDTMRKMAVALNKFGTMMILFFAIPIILELPEVLRLWLKQPPAYTYGLCVLALALCCVDNISKGQMLVVNATGKIKAYHIFLCTISIFTLPFAWGAVAFGGSVYVMQCVLLFMVILNAIGRVFFANYLVKMSAMHWVTKSLLPLILLATGTCIGGYIPHLFMSQSVFRIVITSIFTEITWITLGWVMVLNKSEKEFLLLQIDKVKARFMRFSE